MKMRFLSKRTLYLLHYIALFLTFRVKKGHSEFKTPSIRKQDSIILKLAGLWRFYSCHVDLAAYMNLLGACSSPSQKILLGPKIYSNFNCFLGNVQHSMIEFFSPCTWKRNLLYLNLDTSLYFSFLNTDHFFSFNASTAWWQSQAY